MKHRFMRLCFAVAAPLALAAVALNVRGVWATDVWSIGPAMTGFPHFDEPGVDLYTGASGVRLVWRRWAPDRQGAPARSAVQPAWRLHHWSGSWPGDAGNVFDGWGFAIHKSETEVVRGVAPLIRWAVTVPSWFTVGVPFVVTVYALSHLRRERRSRLRGRCANCFYDLRGGPHDRCPECGEAVDAVVRV